jgi:hypothetical protein
MPAVFTILGVLLIIVAIPFGLMFAPLALGIVFAYLGWKHLSASWQLPAGGGAA